MKDFARPEGKKKRRKCGVNLGAAEFPQAGFACRGC